MTARAGRLWLALLLSVLAATPIAQTAAGEPSSGTEPRPGPSAGPVIIELSDVDLSSLAVAPGYRLEVDSAGYDLPTAIAVIPAPFEGSDAPFYFVAELQGTIKVVTRDRTVHDFASVPTWGKQGHELSGNSQQGLAGLCLAPDHGYLFATFTEPDAGGVMRNRIVRFAAAPRGYALTPTAVAAMAPEISEFQAAPAHQIGGCVVEGGRLYVGVGDGGNPKVAADPAELLGKVLCLTLDGRPCPGAPYGQGGPAAFVYATGFRNPFGLAWQGSRLHVVENGVNLDRFLPVTPGRDHLWSGTDDALASLAEIIFPDPFAPVQLAYVPPGASYMHPDWSGHFVSAGYGSKHVPSGVAEFGGQPRAGELAHTPRYLIEYLGPSETQHFAGIAAGSDGLYVTPMLPLPGANGVVLRLAYDPASAHVPTVSKVSGLFRSPELGTLSALGCSGCHAVAGTGGGIAPNLDRFGIEWRITEFLNSGQYVNSLASLQGNGESEREAARHRVLAVTGSERTWVWVKELLLDPRFDDPQRQMPDLGLTVDEAETARADLYAALDLRHKAGSLSGLLSRVRDNQRSLLVGAFTGAVMMLLAIMALEILPYRWRQRKAATAAAHEDRDAEASSAQDLNRGTDRPLPTSSGEYR